MNYSAKFDAKLPVDGFGAPQNPHLHVDSVSAHGAPAGAIIVPDAELLFHGDFKRSGVDLVVSRDDQELVLHDYFKGEKRAALSSPDGAHLTGDIVNALTGHQQFAQADGSASVAKVIGHVSKLSGTATAIRNGVSIILNNGDNVEKGDVVQSGSGSTLGITFIDGTVFGLLSNAKMVLNEMVYDPNGSNNSSLLSLVAGTISFVAGETAKHGDMKVDTPVATMGIRGTAVLVEIDFDVPAQGGAPAAKFQVLVEPDGTTGRYVLFDKVTLAPIATVDQAGVVKSLSQGILTSYASPLSPDVQKLITDVFSLKFTDNTNPNTKTAEHFTDTLLPQAFTPIKLADGTTATPIILNVSTTGNPQSSDPNGTINDSAHIPGPPAVAAVGGALIELIGVTHSPAADTVTGIINFTDLNKGDLPTVTTKFDSFAYENAQHQDVTASLNAEQLADIAAVEAKLVLDANSSNNNNGTVSWTYSMVDSAFDFIAAGETLTLTYMARVDNNFAPNDETGFQSFTITITRGSNDVPVITTSSPAIAFSGGTSTPGGDMTPSGPTSGTLSFTDVDLTDTHTVSAKLTGAVLSGAGTVPPGPLKVFETALAASIATDSTGTGSGAINWSLADLPAFLADFIPNGETLTLTYTVTVTDSQNATGAKDITVTITGTNDPAVVWIATSTQDSQPGGLWRDAANWETGTVPTATDDVIIITNQLIGLTPSFPVTIDTAAFAKSVTMNDFGSSKPELINQSSLTISGVLSLGEDSIVDNQGTISVAGLMEVLDHSLLDNSGLLTLANGGDFEDQSTISNKIGGTIDVTGGTLNVHVNIYNAGQITVEPNAKLTLASATIDGAITNKGEIDLTAAAVLKNGTLGNSGQIKVSGTGNALDNETVTNNNVLEVMAGGALLLELGTKVANAGGNVTVDDAATLTLNSASIDGGTVTNQANGLIGLAGDAVLKNGLLSNSGQINVSGIGNALDGETVTNAIAGTIAVAMGGTLRLDLCTSIVGGIFTNSGLVQIETVATLDGVSVENYGVSATLSLTGKLVVDDGTTITGGTMTIGPSGILEVETAKGATFDGVSVDNFGVVQVDANSTLDLSDTTIAGGTVIDKGTLNLDGSSVLKNGTLNNTGRVNAEGTNKLDSETVNNCGTGSIDITGNLTLDHGTSIINDGANNAETVESGASLTLLDSSGVTGGKLTNRGTIDSTGTNALHGVEITNHAHGIIEATGGVLTIDANSTIANFGTLEASGGELELTNITLINAGTLQAIDNSKLELTDTTVTNNGGTITVAAGSTLDLDGSDSISAGALGNDGFVDAGGTIALHGVEITNHAHGIIEATDGVLTIDANGTIANFGTLEANGGELELTKITLTNAGTLQAIDNSKLELTDTTVTNKGGTITVAGGSTLDLDGSDSISAGALGNDGFVDAGGTIALHGVEITNHAHGIIEATDGVLTIDANGTVSNAGLMEANGGALDITNETVTNSGTLEAVHGSLLALNNTIVNNTGGTIEAVDPGPLASSTVSLYDVTITGGTVATISDGIINTTGGINAIHGAIINNAGTFEVTGGTLTIDAASIINNSGTLEVNCANLIVDTEFSGAARIVGASLLELGAKCSYSSANIVFASESSGILKLDHSMAFDGKVSGLDDNTLDLADISYAGATVSYAGDSSGGILTIANGGYVAHIHLTGDYTGVHWALSDDGHQGTDLTEVPGAIAGLDANGNAVEGAAVTALITDGGDSVTKATYQWLLDGQPIPNATNAIYVPTESDEGHALAVKVSFVDALDHIESSVASAGTVAESPTENATISLTGLNDSHNAVQGQLITATVTESDAPNSGIVYTWTVDGHTVHSGTDANGATYTPTEADEGNAIKVAVSFTDTHGNHEVGTTSAGTVQESVGGDLVATLDSLIAKQGVAIHVTGVTDGGIPVSSGLSYAWQTSSDGHNWAAVGHGNSYTPREADEGKVLQLVVTYADATGTESSTYDLGMPNDLTAKLDRTTAEQGVAIHVTGVKDGGDTVSRGVSYAWQTSSDNGQHWATVGHDSSYTPALADDGKMLQVVVTYVDEGEHESTTESVGIVMPAKVWNGGNHDWQTAEQSTPSGVPTSSDDAVVAASGTIKVSQDAAAHSLIENSTGATVEITGGHTLTLGGDLAVGAGAFRIDSGATLKDIAANATMTGTLADDGTIEAGGGTLEIAGNVTGKGTFKIDAGATLQLDHADDHNVVFAAAGELILKDPTHFTGTISHSGGVSLDSGDVIDIAGFDATATVSYSGTTAGGKVTIHEDHHTDVVLQVGVNSTNWTPPVSDGHGGILIHDPPENSNVAASDDLPTGAAGRGDAFVFSFATTGPDLAPHFDPSVDALHFAGSGALAKPPAIAEVTQDALQAHTIGADVYDAIALSGVLKAQLSFTDFHTV